MNGQTHAELLELQLPSPHTTPKTAKRELKEILQKYEIDEDIIDNINDDFLKGFAIAGDIVNAIVRADTNREWKEKRKKESRCQGQEHEEQEMD